MLPLVLLFWSYRQWKNQTNGEASAFLSIVSVRQGDSGSYSCRTSQAQNTVIVHVLNGNGSWRGSIIPLTGEISHSARRNVHFFFLYREASGGRPAREFGDDGEPPSFLGPTPHLLPPSNIDFRNLNSGSICIFNLLQKHTVLQKPNSLASSSRACPPFVTPFIRRVTRIWCGGVGLLCSIIPPHHSITTNNFSRKCLIRASSRQVWNGK